ncbi:hypothetical protein Tco_0113427, partial [Tanacetum coccineum]
MTAARVTPRFIVFLSTFYTNPYQVVSEPGYLKMSGNEDHHRHGRRLAAGGNGHDGRDPRDVEIERLRQRVCKLEINPFFEGDGSSFDEWRDYGMADDDYEGPPIFDDQYKDESCPVYDTDNEEDEDGDEEEVVYTDNEEESEVIYDTGRNDVEDSPKFELLHSDQGKSLVIQQVLSVAPSKSIDDNSCRRNNIFRTKCTSKYKVCKMIIIGGSCENVVSTYMVEKLAKIVDHPDPFWLRKGKTIKVRGRVIIMKGNLMKGIQIWMLRVKGT